MSCSHRLNTIGAHATTMTTLTHDGAPQRSDKERVRLLSPSRTLPGPTLTLDRRSRRHRRCCLRPGCHLATGAGGGERTNPPGG
ncbi:hypothetical protein Pmani_012795 [Petrolisthes manimaculis]|uniref:Uncharacterized protein n=1 Tax=Petrolisthes manimaculis TaxID=1843537 RepID=A0AAE1PWJ7_9EUCA|nr:hypothetical protein Pmani_012795 [Petrolisthes manimaculis]